ncbi:MAG: hypothetical protein OMM_09895 [Candidatus Magnetoglobus multicellularis str. Araruama]|uniref:Uncharacterized protein n=1 Tax=Candidatus Magnetoglobus multicellularis str. Araruama TaxID=890399 RepID=A0A1V1P2K8_9BACT|nr:MAG: hypothetical protein OMM_09895 [Candidatus Magnetoglobus multicellularis str. Araruama]
MSEAGSGAILSGAGASTTFNNDTNVLAVLGDNSTIIVDAIDVWSNHNQQMDSKVDAKSFGLLAGTGGWIKNTITGSANVDIGANTSVTANQLFLSAKNVFDKDKYASENNLYSGSASIAGLTELSSTTTIGKKIILMSQLFPLEKALH